MRAVQSVLLLRSRGRERPDMIMKERTVCEKELLELLLDIHLSRGACMTAGAHRHLSAGQDQGDRSPAMPVRENKKKEG